MSSVRKCIVSFFIGFLSASFCAVVYIGVSSFADAMASPRAYSEFYLKQCYWGEDLPDEASDIYHYSEGLLDRDEFNALTMPDEDSLWKVVRRPLSRMARNDKNIKLDKTRDLKDYFHKTTPDEVLELHRPKMHTNPDAVVHEWNPKEFSDSLYLFKYENDSAYILVDEGNLRIYWYYC